MDADFYAVFLYIEESEINQAQCFHIFKDFNSAKFYSNNLLEDEWYDGYRVAILPVSIKLDMNKITRL